MNKTIIIGNLTKDVETRTTQNGKTTSNFTVAVQRNYKNGDGEREADFIPVVAWGTTAEICSKYLDKGKKVAVSGRIQTRSYDAQDGSKRYVTELVADEVQLLTPQSTDSNSNSSQKPNTKNNNQQNSSRPKPNEYEPMADMSEIDEEMPF